MKICSVFLILLVVFATIALIMVSLEGNPLFGVTGLSLIYFAGAAWYFIESYTIKKKS